MAGETVIVCCKLPNGLHLDLPGKPRVTILGNSVPYGEVPGHPIQTGYAMTMDVPAAFWEEWLRTHGTMEIVERGLIFAHTDNKSAVAHSKEMEKELTGLERKDPSVPGTGLERVAI